MKLYGFGESGNAYKVALMLTLTGTPWHWGYAAVLVYLGGITLLLHRWQERALVEDPKGFVRRFMTGLVIKMFLSIFVLVVLLLIAPKPVVVPLALCFALLYLAYLVFSTTRLLRLSRTAPRP